METRPLVSIITPAYNSEVFIAETINSVIAQTYSHWELIIVDDNSKDSTLEIINAFKATTPKIQCVSNTTNQGAAVSRNKAIELAKGDYIAFLDADDIWKPKKLEEQIAYMLKHHLDVCYCSYDLMLDNGKLLEQTVKALPILSYKKLLKCNYIGNLTGVYNAKTLGKVYAPNLRKRQDWLMWLKAVKQSGVPAKGIETSLAIYRLREGGLSSNKFNLLKYNYLVYKRGLGLSTISSLFHLIIFLFEYFFIKSKQTVISQ